MNERLSYFDASINIFPPEKRKQLKIIQLNDLSGFLPQEIDYIKEYEKDLDRKEKNQLKRILDSKNDEEIKIRQVSDYLNNAINSQVNIDLPREYIFQKEKIDVFIENLISFTKKKGLLQSILHIGKTHKYTKLNRIPKTLILIRDLNELDEKEKECLEEILPEANSIENAFVSLSKKSNNEYILKNEYKNKILGQIKNSMSDVFKNV